MKILSISNYFPEHIGGIEIVASNLVQRWRTNHQVYWAACETPDRPHPPEVNDLALSANNFTEERLGFPYPIPSIHSLYQIVTHVRRSDIIHFHDCLYLANLIAFLASRLYRKPVIVTQHVALIPYVQEYKKVLQKLAYQTLGRLVLGRAEQVVFISQNVKTWFEQRVHLRKPALYIPNGVDREHFHPANSMERETVRAELGIPRQATVLLFAGRFTEKKGIGIIQKLALQQTNWLWILVGKGEFDPNHWNLPNVYVNAPVPHIELRRFYIAADLFILPSQGEGFPLAAQEALSCGLPVALSDETTTAFPDAPLIKLNIRDLYSMISTLDEILSDPDQLANLRAASLRYAECLNWDTVSRQYEEIFVSLHADLTDGIYHE